MKTAYEKKVEINIQRNKDLVRIAHLEAALKKIASCESRVRGDVVWIAKEALGEQA